MDAPVRHRAPSLAPSLAPLAVPHFDTLHLSLLALVLVLLWDLSGLDLPLMRALAADGHFAWRDAWLTRSVLHQGGRWLSALGLGLLAVNVWRPLWRGPSRGERGRWLLVTAGGMLLIALIKRASPSSCPWDLAEFGGSAHYLPHWQALLGHRGDGGPGGCFPAGHASAALAFISGWFVLRPYQPRLARLWLAAVLLLGFALGLGQTLRGAHYPSHTLWTAWLCWAFNAALLAPRRARQPG